MARKSKHDVLVSYDFLPIFEKLIQDGKALSAAELSVAIIRYDMDETEPQFSDDSVGFVWETVIKPKLDENKRAYAEVGRARSEAGRCGGLAKAENQREQTLPNVPNGNFANQDNQTYQSVHDNVNDYVYVNDNVNDNDKKRVKREKPQKHKYGTYNNVLLSDVELQKLQTEFPLDWEIRIERVSEYCASHGKSYKDYLATIRNWARRENNQTTAIRKNDAKAGYLRALELMGEEDDG